MTPLDLDEGTPMQMGGLHIDYNEPPSVLLEDIFAPQYANVEINYELFDSESDTIDLFCEYNSGGDGNSTVLGSVNNITNMIQASLSSIRILNDLATALGFELLLVIMTLDYPMKHCLCILTMKN